ncbi:MAG: PAS domain-containing sensor histidine kinase [Melioribacteraceae bacterium]|nr:PAS domain-containing sensor histidine kinase [Melioribacteraceae bacterium]
MEIENLELSKEELLEEIVRLREENEKLKSKENIDFTKKALSKITSKLKAVFENNTQSYLLIDNEFKIKAFNETVNKRIKLVFSKKLEKGESVFKYIRDEDLEKFQENIVKAFEGDYASDAEVKYVFRGKVLWYEFHFAPILSEDGSVNEVFINAQNITGRKNTEEELKFSEEKIRAILEAIPDIVIRFEETGEIVDYHSSRKDNPIFNSNKVIGENIFQIFPKILSKGLIYYIEKCKEDNSTQRIEYKFLKKGTEHYEEARLVPIENSQFLMILRNVTTRKVAETELKRYVNELQIHQARLKDQSEKLKNVNDKLAKSEESLKELNINKDKFFSIIAHDLKNPFNILLGYTGLMVHELEELEPSEIKDFASRIDNAAKNTFDLLDNLLEWARIQRDRIEFTPKTCKVKDMVSEIFYTFKILATEKNIVLNKHIDKDLTIYADENMILTVLRNLISNAIKYTNEHGLILVSAEVIGKEVKFSISDNGVGMTDKTLSKIFKLEEHVTTHGTKNERGTGLGLLLCKDFVEKNGGKIWADSIEGKGSHFHFTVSKNKF